MSEKPSGTVEIICKRIATSAKVISQYENDIIELQNMGDYSSADKLAELQNNELEQLQNLTVLITSFLTTEEIELEGESKANNKSLEEEELMENES